MNATPETLETLTNRYRHELEMLSKVDGRGALLLKIHKALHPEMRQDIIKLLTITKPGSIPDLLNRHYEIIQFFNEVGYNEDGLGGFLHSGIRYFENLLARQELDELVATTVGQLEQTTEGDPKALKPLGIKSVEELITSMPDKATYKFQEEGDEVYVEAEGVFGEAFTLPRHYFDNIAQRFGNKVSFNEDIRDMGPLIMFFKLKMQHYNELLKNFPVLLYAKQTAVTDAQQKLTEAGGPLSSSEEHELFQFIKGNDSKYSASVYLVHFDKWQRQQLGKELQRYQ